jgi:predicted phage baseplate assembly protein
MAQISTICGGCAGIAAATPSEPGNRPGLPVVSARLGGYGTFWRTQLAMLSSSELGKLSELRTREPDDYSIALIDAWSTIGEVLSFYGDQFTNEALLATAVEPLSLREMARLVGYRPSPGVAAGATVAYSMSEAPGSPSRVVIPMGAKVMSTPGQDEQAVTYETSADITARVAWNGVRPRLTQLHPLPATATTLYVAGLATGLTAGDAVWFTADDAQSVFALVRKVTLRPADKSADPASIDVTEITIERVGGAPNPLPAATPPAILSAVALTAPAQLVWGQTLAAEDIPPLLAEHKVSEEDVFAPYQALARPGRYVLALRSRASIFGNLAPKLSTLPDTLKGQIVIYKVDGGVVKADHIEDGPFHDRTAATWADEGDLTLLDDGGTNVYLDSVQDGVRAGSFVVLRDGATWSLYRADAAVELTKNEFTLSAKCTRLTLNTSSGFANFKIRTASVYCESELLALAEVPIAASVTDGSATAVDLQGWFPGLTPGQDVVVSGRTLGGGGAPASEVLTLSEVEHVFAQDGGTRVKFAPAISGVYFRAGLRINANAVDATHGESVFEILGGGDSRVPFQSFRTKQAPETFTTAAVPGGAKSTLEVRVNNVLWHEVPNFLDRGPAERIYVTRLDAEGYAVITFGDGINGARLPTGADNVRVRYRKGIGLVGRVRAHQLNQAMTRPLGISTVDNPLPSEGGADPQGLDSLKQNIPLTVRTLDRAVSLLDYEDFARSYAGVAKALAVPQWDIGGELVFVTVAGEDGAPIADPSTIRTALIASVRAAGDPYSRFAIANYLSAYFQVAISVKVDPDYLTDEVLSGVEATLRDRFSFARRSFAQPVAASEVLAAAHSVAGVVAVNIGSLYRSGTPGNFVRLPADPPIRLPDGSLRAAELLTLHPGPLDALTVMS